MRLINRSKDPTELHILQWNAGGLSQPKRLEILHTLSTSDIDMFSVQEANLTVEMLKFYPFEGYSLYLLPKYRQIASGILIGTKRHLTADFGIVKEMGDGEDKTEIAVVRLWKAGVSFTVYSLYIPLPQNLIYRFSLLIKEQS